MSTRLPVFSANWVKRQRHKVKREAKSNQRFNVKTNNALDHSH